MFQRDSKEHRFKTRNISDTSSFVDHKFTQYPKPTRSTSVRVLSLQPRGKQHSEMDLLNVAHNSDLNYLCLDIKSRGNCKDVTNSSHEKLCTTSVETKYPVLPESLFINNVSPKNGCQSVKETSCSKTLFVSSDSRCKNNNRTPFSKFKCTKCGFGNPCTIFICRRIKSFNNIEKSHSQSKENHLSSEVPNYFAKNEISNVMLSKCHENDNTDKTVSIFSFDIKENTMQCRNDLNKSNLNFESSKNHSLVCDTGALNSSVLKDGFNSSQICSSKMLSFQNSFNVSKLVEDQSSEMPFVSLSQGTRNFLSELAASSTPAICNDNVSGYALSSLSSTLSYKEKITTTNDFNDKVMENECLSNSNDEVIVKTNDQKPSVLHERVECTLKKENTSELDREDISSLKNDEDMSVVFNDDITKPSSKNNYDLDDQNNTLSSNMSISVSNVNDGSVESNKPISNPVESMLASNADESMLTSNVDESMLTSNADESMLTSNAQCSDSVTKDITNALDLIEQCSLHDQNLSSAEICNSLNNIFCEANVALSASAVSNVQCSQSVETGTDYETITLQTVESDAASAVVGDVTINLADLGLGDNPELLQQIYLVQDEAGNIQTVLLLPDDAQIVENVSVDDAQIVENVSADAEQISVLKDNTESTQIDQHIILSNTSTGVISDEVKKMLVTEGVLETPEKSLPIEKDHEHKLISENILSEEENQHENNESNDLNHVNGDCTFSEKETMDVADIISNATVPESENAIILTSPAAATENDSHKDSELKELFDAENDKDSSEHSKKLVDANMNQQFSLETEIHNSQISIKVPETISNESKLISNDVKYANKLLDITEPEACKTDQNTESIENRRNSKDYKQTLVSSGNISDISISNNLCIFQPQSKAKKRCSSASSKTKSFVNSNQNNSMFNGILNSVANKISSASPMNGDAYHSETELSDKSHSNDASSSSKYQYVKSKLFSNKSIQKSKKTLIQNPLHRSAKKSFFPNSKISCGSLHVISPSTISTIFDSSASGSFGGITIDSEHLMALKKLMFKRGLEGEIDMENISKRPKTDFLRKTFNSELINNFKDAYLSKTRSVALKTFKKPFTAAKKSVFEPRETSRKLNTALKTCVPKTVALKSAVKSFTHLNVKDKPKRAVSTDKPMANVALIQNQLKSSESNVYFQPEVCEIRILPNDYVKRASDLLLKANDVDSASTPEENLSEDDIKSPSECVSPLEDIIQFRYQCTCTAKELPCLCNEGDLQIKCEAEDTVDDKNVPCTNHVSKQYLLTPSSEIKHRAFCDIHLWRLQQHHCCPKCGVFCSQGDFLLCTYDDEETKENHLFHSTCSIVPSPGLPPGCPHCCKFSNFTPVKLIYRPAEEEQTNLPCTAQNITSGIKNCDVYLTVKEDASTEPENHSDMFIPQKKEVQLMITSLAKEKSLRLRPTGKCLYNPIKTGDVQKVMQLIGNGVNPNHKFRMHRNNSPLHVAAHYGWTGILHILLQAGAYIDSVNDDLETPLIVAVEKNQLPIVRYLVLAGAQIDVKDCNGMTSFHIASKNGFKEIAEFLYSTGRIDVNLQDDGGWTALVWACEHKHLEFVKWLLEIGADPNVRDNEENTVLHWAAYSGKREIAELLLDKGCTLSYVNRRGDSALHIASREDNYECVKLFINRGAVVDQKNKENKTPLMCCQDDSLSFNYLIQSISSGALKIGKLQLEKHVVFRDISRGAEAYPIQAVNEIDEEEFIMEFRYVVKQCHRSGVDIISTVNNMQFCYCKDNCLTRDCNCTMNSACWYDVNGCLTSEYDLQNTPAIFECNKTCHCPKTCINRVAQHGLKFPLQIFRTQYQGWGVRALQEIPKGAFVCEYVGELITGAEAVHRTDDTYLFDLQSQDSDYCLDGRYFGNVARFLNHSCEPNLIALKVFVDHQDMNFPRIAFFAFKEVQAFEELCFDYGLDFWLAKCQTILCTCNTQSCKYSKDTIDDTLWKFFKDTSNGEQFNTES